MLKEKLKKKNISRLEHPSFGVGGGDPDMGSKVLVKVGGERRSDTNRVTSLDKPARLIIRFIIGFCIFVSAFVKSGVK